MSPYGSASNWLHRIGALQIIPLPTTDQSPDNLAHLNDHEDTIRCVYKSLVKRFDSNRHRQGRPATSQQIESCTHSAIQPQRSRAQTWRGNRTSSPPSKSIEVRFRQRKGLLKSCFIRIGPSNTMSIRVHTAPAGNAWQINRWRSATKLHGDDHVSDWK